MRTLDPRNVADLRAAYRAGQRSSRSSVDSDEAAERWSRRHCPPHPPGVIMCALEHAWYDGFEHDCHDEAPDYIPGGTRRTPASLEVPR